MLKMFPSFERKASELPSTILLSIRLLLDTSQFSHVPKPTHSANDAVLMWTHSCCCQKEEFTLLQRSQEEPPKAAARGPEASTDGFF